jgi:RhoGEF domain
MACFCVLLAQRCRSHPKHSQLNLESYLLLPVQRIPRYKLLLESLVACTPADDGSSTLSPHPVLGKAVDLMTALASEMNERKRESEGRHRLLYWQQRIGNRFKSPLVQPHRHLVREGSMVDYSTLFFERRYSG